MKIAKKRLLPAIFTPLLFLLSSCFGVNADIALNQNGSGTIAVEYHISGSIDAIGRLDGNERWNTIPVGRADFERTLDRLPGMKLLSYSSANEGKNLVIRAKMEFESIQGLLAFMDAQGRRSSFTGDGKSGRLAITLNEARENQAESLRMLVSNIAESYFVRMSMSFPSEGNLVITNAGGNHPITIPGSESSARGRRVFFSFPLYEVLYATEGIAAEFSW